MNASHTPGPWSVPSDDQARSALSVSGVPILAHNRSYDDNLAIFTVPANALFGGREEALANARLIAAAPDMLAALEGARTFIENGTSLGFIRMPDEGTTDAAHDTLPAICAAVAKARGEAA